MIRIPTGPMPYHEACAIVQDWLAERWAALAGFQRDEVSAEYVAKAALCRERAAAFRAAPGTAICVMKL